MTRCVLAEEQHITHRYENVRLKDLDIGHCPCLVVEIAES
jgi:hypothetical protein